MSSLDSLALSIDLLSILSLTLVAIIGTKAVRAFRQSKQAVTESASLLSVIVEALSARIQRSESMLVTLRSDVTSATRRSEIVQGGQIALQTSYEEITHQLNEMLSTDRKLVLEIEQLKTKFSQPQSEGRMIDGLPKPENFAAVIPEGDVLSSLTPTERHTLEILKAEGAKGAPELGKLLKKSREHTSRLMKKLYMEGYVNRESNHAPFRYRLNDAVRSALELGVDNRVSAEQRETP